MAGFADPIETSVVLEYDLEAIYKPCYPDEHPVTAPQLGIDPCSGQGLDRELTVRTTTSPMASVLESAPLAMSKYQRRKNQQIRVVEHITAEDLLLTDKWAWRKYGQKPVKGSPYQRSYYRCSTSRGCPARKKVERSGSDPRAFIVIYADDHNHPQPARRNSLAGSTRKRLPDVVPNDNDNSRTDPEVPTVEGPRADSPISTVVMSSPKGDLIIESSWDQRYSCQGEPGFGEVMVEDITDDGRMVNPVAYSEIEAFHGNYEQMG